MSKKSDKSSSYVIQMIVGLILIVLFIIDAPDFSIIDYLKLGIGLIGIGHGIYGLSKEKKRKSQSNKQ